MMFPRFVFKDGGKLQREGGHYSELLVEDESAYDEAIAEGWFASLPEAIAGAAEDDSTTRAELEELANELGVAFDGRTSDKKLIEKIKAASEG